MKYIHRYWSELAKKYGEVFKLEVPGVGPIVVTTNPDHVEKMYKSTMNDPIRDGFHSLKNVRMKHSDNFFEGKGGLLVE